MGILGREKYSRGRATQEAKAEGNAWSSCKGSGEPSVVQSEISPFFRTRISVSTYERVANVSQLSRSAIGDIRIILAFAYIMMLDMTTAFEVAGSVESTGRGNIEFSQKSV